MYSTSQLCFEKSHLCGFPPLRACRRDIFSYVYDLEVDASASLCVSAEAVCKKLVCELLALPLKKAACCLLRQACAACVYFDINSARRSLLSKGSWRDDGAAGTRRRAVNFPFEALSTLGRLSIRLNSSLNTFSRTDNKPTFDYNAENATPPRSERQNQHACHRKLKTRRTEEGLHTTTRGRGEEIDASLASLAST